MDNFTKTELIATVEELTADVTRLKGQLNKLVTVLSQQRYCPDGQSCNDDDEDCYACWMRIAKGEPQ